ncbi:hypothetical protein [Hymenobacter sp. GOD-10R]|uniref:hypothetical protein n=1 Tax=Hymenobacter sp. GOD-10R TaxID=3093922 RepID=UPI002D76A662|nr:hypothetical protein [Hymenobacter sp. GOD-10R]WRQ30459.1 hypothetical protein SD425_09315 [Hymenobacter sp. GOD-10R]
MYTLPNEVVTRETISTLRFPASDVLTTTVERQQRRWQAERAAVLGNGYQSKVNIYFQTSDGSTKRVHTTVWASDAEFISLKSGKALPLRAVLGFDFY